MRIGGLLLTACIACGCACSDPATGRRDAGARDAGALDAASVDAASPVDATAPTDAGDTADATSPIDATSPADAFTSDAAIATDAGAADGGGGCVPGAARTCMLMCTTGGSAMGVERCVAGSWTACARSPEACGNGLDDDIDGTVDEGCRVEGGCIWLRPQCQGIQTLNDWCASAGGRRLVAGRRCEVAGGDVVALSTTYGEYPLCCCDRVSMCVPECTDASCSGCVVWDEIQCCPP